MYLGIDLGTSGVKVILMDDEQHIIATSHAALRVSHPKPLWSEQNPDDWWTATQKAVHAIKQTHKKQLAKVRALGFSGQMHGATLLNKQGRPLRAAILWNDGRAMTQCQTLMQREPRALQITGNLIMPGFTAPKVLWVRDNEPAIFAQTKKILLPKDYLRLLISGDYATDCSDASGTMWLNVGKRAWSPEMLAAGELSLDYMPQLYEGSAITGKVSTAIAQDWGIPKNTVIVAGGGDNAASAISVGVIATGNAFLSLGTSGVYFVADEKYQPNPGATVHTFCHCLPNRWHEMSVHLSAASCLTWLKNLLAVKNLNTLIATAKKHETDANTPIFLPYLSGERSPLNDPYARGVFFGMTHETKSYHLVQAVLEGVAFAFAQGQRAMLAAGVKINDISVVGGGARTLYWGEILSAALNQTLTYRQAADMGGAYGAARLAWLAMHDDDPVHAFPPPPILREIKAEKQRILRYKAKQKLFAELYQQLKGTFAAAYHA
jgi:xylulokinase